ncbi:MAG: nucleoside hydrolase [Anaerolineaceae bacterium]|nr:nucleoside hydrolase [Anaerolineaceae bacterium]
MSKRILLDTDIGSDIDDAVALAYLLMQPEADILGVTTVSGQSLMRAEMVDAICRVTGQELPIYPGVEEPLLIPNRQPLAQQALKLDDWPHKSTFPAHQAVDFLAKQILANPGEVTLLTIGPLTNIALLFALYPETIDALEQLVMMCGVFTDMPDNPWKAEWNALLDPHATEMVYNAPVKIHRSIGLDVTRQVRMSAQEVKARFTHPVFAPVVDFAEVWFREQEYMIFHDPLAAVSIFDPDVCQFTRGQVTVNSDAAAGLLGETLFDPEAGEKPHEVALQVAPERFFDSYFEVFR